MALIVCPECNKQISDQAEACPHCGYPIKRSEEIIATNPNPANNKQKRKTVLTIIAICCVILGIATLITCLMLIKRDNDAAEAARQESARQESIRQESIEKSEEEEAARIEAYNQYVLVANTFMSEIASGEDAAYALCRLQERVWYNAIWEVSNSETDKYTKPNGVFVEDFNDALDAFHDDHLVEIGYLLTNRDQVEALHKKLMSAPSNLEKLSGKIEDLYVSYRKYTALIVEGGESYNSFSEKFETYAKQFRELYEEVNALIPDYQ